MAPPSINVLMSCVVGCVVDSVYFCKIFFDFCVNAFVINFFPTSTAALLPASKAFFAPSLSYAFTYIESGRCDLFSGATRKHSR